MGVSRTVPRHPLRFGACCFNDVGIAPGRWEARYGGKLFFDCSTSTQHAAQHFLAAAHNR
jgi:hypothetical protein